MAVPLFVADLATLKPQLRLSLLEDGDDAHEVLEHAILAVRAGFYAALGSAKVAALVAIPFDAVATDNDGILRVLANTVEVKWIRMELLRTMKVFFGDQTSAAREDWNENGFLGLAGEREKAKEIQRLQSDIDQAMALLKGDQTLGAVSEILVYDGTPEKTTPRIGDSLWDLSNRQAAED